MGGRGGIPPGNGMPGIPRGGMPICGMPIGGIPIGGMPGIMAEGAGPPKPRTGPAKPTGAIPAAGVGKPGKTHNTGRKKIVHVNATEAQGGGAEHGRNYDVPTKRKP